MFVVRQVALVNLRVGKDVYLVQVFIASYCIDVQDMRAQGRAFSSHFHGATNTFRVILQHFESLSAPLEQVCLPRAVHLKHHAVAPGIASQWNLK